MEGIDIRARRGLLNQREAVRFLDARQRTFGNTLLLR